MCPLYSNMHDETTGPFLSSPFAIVSMTLSIAREAIERVIETMAKRGLLLPQKRHSPAVTQNCHPPSFASISLLADTNAKSRHFLALANPQSLWTRPPPHRPTARCCHSNCHPAPPFPMWPPSESSTDPLRPMRREMVGNSEWLQEELKGFSGGWERAEPGSGEIKRDQGRARIEFVGWKPLARTNGISMQGGSDCCSRIVLRMILDRQ